MHNIEVPQGFRSAPPYLTPRQTAILDLIKLGMTDEEIAEKLGTTRWTVANRVSHGILSRLGARNRAHAVYIGMRRKIIS